MFKIFETQNYNDNIIMLWHDVFGDSEEEISYFLDNCVNKSCMCLEYDGVLASMLFLVDCKLGEENYKYVYAACTAEAFRDNGFMTDLLECSIRSYYNVLLIPAEVGLIGFYRKIGFDSIVSISDIHFDENEKICEYLFEGCVLAEPFALAHIEVKEDNT